MILTFFLNPIIRHSPRQRNRKLTLLKSESEDFMLLNSDDHATFITLNYNFTNIFF